MTTPVLSLRGVTKRFGGLVAVNAMDFDVAEREVVGLLGPNGSGKSTTLNLVSGALPLSSGNISLWGNRISGLPAQTINRKTTPNSCWKRSVLAARAIWRWAS